MADNVSITAGTGTIIGADELTDGTLGTVKVAYGKIMDGTLNSSNKLIVNSDGSAQVTTVIRSSDFWPFYNDMSIGGLPIATDPAGALITRGAITTDEGSGLSNFTGSSPNRSIGTCTFTNGSTTVTGTGFTSTDVHYLDFIKLNGDAESAWAEVAFIISSTEIQLFFPYTGTGGSGAASVTQAAQITGTGATISVGSGQLTMALGTNGSAQTYIYRPATTGSAIFKTSLSISQRIANQDIYIGPESNVTGTINQFARFHFSGTDNTKVITETGYNPSTTPSSSEQETNTITYASSGTSATAHVYQIEQQAEKIVFSIDSVIVATHNKRIPHVNTEGFNVFTFDIRGINSGVVTATSVVVDYMFNQTYDRIETFQSSTGGLPAGSNLLGKVGIDQTTPGTTNAVSVAQIGANTVLTGNGVTGTGSQRVTIASDNTAFSVNANAGTNLNTSLLALESGGNLATLAGAVTSSVVQANVKQINGVTPLMGNGTTGTGSQRVTIASDNTAFAVNATLSAETTKVIGVTRTADGAGNLLTTNSTTYTAKFGLDGNLLGTLGTAFSTAGKVDVKSADGDVFVRSNAASTFPVQATLQTQTDTVMVGGVNIKEINAVTPLMGNGATGTGSLRATLSNDNTGIANWGHGATGSAVPSGAQYKGGIATTSLPSAATAGNLTGIMIDKFGRQVTLNNAFRDILGSQTTTISASTAETTIITAASNIFNDLVSLFISNTSATATRVDIRDTTSGSIIFQLYLPAGDVRGIALATPWPQTSVNTNWTAQSSASVTDLRVSTLFIKNK